MTDDEHRKKLEDLEKEKIIVEIEGRIELSSERRDRLKRMTKPELQRLATKVKVAPTKDVIAMIVKAFTDSEHRREEAENEKFNRLCPPARMDF